MVSVHVKWRNERVGNPSKTKDKQSRGTLEIPVIPRKHDGKMVEC